MRWNAGAVVMLLIAGMMFVVAGVRFASRVALTGRAGNAERIAADTDAGRFWMLVLFPAGIGLVALLIAYLSARNKGE